jgi:hypothetical protein
MGGVAYQIEPSLSADEFVDVLRQHESCWVSDRVRRDRGADAGPDPAADGCGTTAGGD